MTETTSDAPVATLRGDRTRQVQLEYPLEFNGELHESVTVRRMTADEMKEFIAAVTEDREAPLPMFSVSAEILDALDPDDFDELNRVATEMLPRQLRRALEAVEPAPVSDPPPAVAQP